MKTYKNYGAPTENTPGNEGDLYVDMNTGDVYRCYGDKTTGNDQGFVTVYAKTVANTTFDWRKTSGGSGGVSSWNDLTDKPFGESLIEYIEWDGVVGDKPTISLMGGVLTLVKVSDITLSDVSDALGAKATCMQASGETMEVTFTEDNTMVEADVQLVLNQNTYTLFILDSTDPSMLGLSVAPEAGVYFAAPSDSMPLYVSKLVFKEPFSVVKKLDMKYVPIEELPEQEPPTWAEIKDKPYYEQGFEYTWDGDTTDKETIVINKMTYVYMGDAILSAQEIKTLLSAEVMYDGEVVSYNSSTQYFVEKKNRAHKYFSICDPNSSLVFGVIVPEDGFRIDGKTFPRRGIYFAKSTDYPNRYCVKLTMPTFMKKLDAQYVESPLCGQIETLTFDGLMASLPQVTISTVAGEYLYRISDTPVYDLSQILSGVWHTGNGSVNIYSEQTVHTIAGDGYCGLSQGSGKDILVVSCFKDNARVPISADGYTTIEKKGLYVMGYADAAEQTMCSRFVSELTVRFNPDKIDPKYLPDTIAPKELILTSSTEGSTKQFKITVADDGTVSAVKVTA